MKNKQLVFTGVTTALLVSNIVIGGQYISDSKDYENELKKQNEIINSIKIESSEMELKLTEKIKNQSFQIQVLHDQLDKVEIEKAALIKEKESLAKKVSMMPSRGTTNNHRKLNVIATSYEPFCDTGCIGITATGKDVSNTIYEDNYRVIATDPSVIPLHSLLKIETKESTIYAIALDTGGRIKGNKIDVLSPNKQKAKEFGKQTVTVTILREGKGDS